jgi:hypothetical protein
MSEIPEDIWKTANKVWYEAEDKIIAIDSQAIIAKAIWAERQKCSKIAEKWKEVLGIMQIAPGSPHQLAVQAVNDISQAILNQTEE